jgi:hypothetical protein
MTLNKLGEDRRALQDVDIVVGSRHTKEGVPNPEIMVATASSITVQPFL